MMRINEWLDLFRRFGIFCCQYGFSKCMRTVVCSLLVMLPLLVWHYCRRGKSGRSGDLSFYSWFLLFPAALTGMSKFFYQRWSIQVQNGISILGHTWVSRAYFMVMLLLALWWLVRKKILSQRLQKLYCWYSLNGTPHKGTKDWQDCVRRVTGKDRWKLARLYLSRVRVYISNDGISPFCGGIFRPYIVMPDLYLEPVGEEQICREDWYLTKRGGSPEVQHLTERRRSREAWHSTERIGSRENRHLAERRRSRGVWRLTERIGSRENRHLAERGGSHENWHLAENEGRPGYENWCLTEQGKVLLCHELLHLKSGHILWINLFALLRIYWWFNPLVYLCERLLQQDMEKACDEGCLYYTDVSEREYGRMLLAMAAGQETMRPVGAATFLKDRDYYSLKSRIGNLRGKCEREQYQSIHKRMSRGCALMLALGILAVGATSYPRYTRLPELILYDENLHLVCNDSPQLRAAVQVVDGYLQIDGERLEECLRELEVEGEYVYLSYDTIMKVPGAGGGGNVGMIAREDCEDVFYLRAETWENDFMEFCLKYLL